MTERRATSLGISQRLAPIELHDWQGVPQRLGTYWKERPIVMVFIRHFG